MNTKNILTNQNDLDDSVENPLVIPSVIDEDYLKEAKKSTILFGDFKFEDDVWFFHKLMGERIDKQAFMIYFNQTPEKHKELVKFYAMFADQEVSTRNQVISFLNHFFKYLDLVDSNCLISGITPEIINNFKRYLTITNLSKTSKNHAWVSVKSFFKVMAGVSGVPFITIARRDNPFTINKKERKQNRRKPIATEDIEELDNLMFDRSNDIPLVVRVHYWTMRLFPNRVNEVSGMKLDCLTPHFNHYILLIPSWKTNGGHRVPETKAITVGYHGITKIYIDMIKELQEQTKALHPYINEKVDERGIDLTNYLFLYGVGFGLKTDSTGKIKVRRQVKTVPRLYASWKANEILKQACEHLGIKDHITTHRFRHNSVTSRSKFGFTDEQTMHRTKHKSKTMLRNYEHIDENYTKSVHNTVTKELNPIDSSPVLFKGTIINMKNQFTEKALKQKGIAPYLVGRLKKPGQTVGVCSQTAVDQCAPDGTPIKYECYACNWFVPLADKYGDYKEDYEYWKERSEKARGNSELAATYENAVRNMALLERVINICDHGIEKYKQQVVEGIEHETVYDWK
ncbi:phage integrase SAM-like domain-containing protein [Pontibacillus sp. HMF3514]|uniref:tyrosine-type recombinase/integrase n=1 Tax=Pontibacillus sp. HMF3514 TaxID=2692425 RepID=UPI00132009C5|nr:phage integrase SAM-like domain-containing protein [Pontibacillus sp. HMF3514]QHE52796.1 hypothetical protein GS400_12505 [Pontibacillus sp. HMF3514]